MQLVVLISIVGLLVNNGMGWRIGSNNYWLPNLEWITNENWINHSIPKDTGRVSFPLEMYHSVGLSSNNLELSGIELPYDGSLILARNGILMMNDVEYAKNNIFKWKLEGPLFWMDPENWSVSNKATPHFERIPCTTDTVILPDKHHTLSIRLPNNDVKVMEIKRGNEETLDEWNWRSLINGREFRNSRMSVRYSGLQLCGADCLCKQDNVEELVEEMCRIQSRRCKRGGCEYPLKVEGHCCDYCGGRISLAAKSTSVSILTQLTNEALENYREGVSWHVRRSWNGRDNQILFAENDVYSGIKSQEAMDKLTEILIAKGFKITDSVNTGAPLTGPSIANILGPMFGIPIVILLLIIVTLPYFGYSYTRILMMWREAYGSVHDGILPDITSQSSESFGFARFENVDESTVQLASAIIKEKETSYRQNNDNDDYHDADDDDDDDYDGGNNTRGKRFENPLYRSRSKIASIAEAHEEKIINFDTAISLNALKDSEVYPPDETTIDDD